MSPTQGELKEFPPQAVKSSQSDATTGSSLHHKIFDHLGLSIADGELPVGAVVTAEELEQQFDVSRSVVRESIRKLELLGMVASRRRVGITVLPMKEWKVFDETVIRWRLASRGRIAQLRSITELRSTIEPHAASLAASRGHLTQASDLMGLAGRLWAAGKSGDMEEFLRLDIQFHALVLEMSGNEMFATLSGIVEEVLVGRRDYGLMPTVPHMEALQLHVDVASGIQRADAAMASDAMRRIMERTFMEMAHYWKDTE